MKYEIVINGARRNVAFTPQTNGVSRVAFTVDGRLVEADAVTEICVTLAPKLAASQPVGHRLHPARLPAPVTMRLEHALVCEDYLFLKYCR